MEKFCRYNPGLLTKDVKRWVVWKEAGKEDLAPPFALSTSKDEMTHLTPGRFVLAIVLRKQTAIFKRSCWFVYLYDVECSRIQFVCNVF